MYILLMPIEFARVQFISRGKGLSVVAAAAYRGAEKIYDERLGVHHDYERKRGVVYNEVLLPEGACQSLKCPNALWNLVEQVENRKNSQLAREIILALPADETVSDEDRVELTRRFVNQHFVSLGLAAQISIHEPHGDSNNIHAHILVTTRRVLGNGFEKKKARDLHPEVRGGRVIKEDRIWKDFWREAQNKYFQEKGLELEVDPNGIISQVHLGKHAYNAHSAQNDKIQENNFRNKKAQEITLTNPDLLLELLTLNESVFSENTLYKTIHRYTHTKEDFDSALQSVLSSKELVSLGANDMGKACFTTKKMFKLETGLQELAHKLKKQKSCKVGQRFVEKKLLNSSLSDEQKRAVRHIVHGQNISAIVGNAGAGKSYTMKVANEIWAKCDYEVIGLSFSKKAAINLEQESGIQSRTIHSFLYGVREGRISLDKNSILVLDEAGMVSAPLLSEVLREAKTAKAKLVLVGDPKQLQPIGPGAPFRAITESIGFAELGEVRRQKVAWQKQASLEFAAQKTNKAFNRYVEAECVQLEEKSCDAFAKIANQYVNEVKENRNTVILAAKNSEVDELNLAVRQQLKQEKILGKENSYLTHKGEKSFAVGDSVMFLKNDPSLGVSNSDIGKVIASDHNSLHIKLNNKKLKISVQPHQYNHISHGYAMTVHKSQGSTYDKAHVYMGDWGWNKQTAYVAFTRHREDLHIYTSKESFQCIKSMSQQLSRSGLKDSVLDFPHSFAKRRGLVVESLMKSCAKHLTEKLHSLAEGIKSKTKQFSLKSKNLSNELDREAANDLELVQRGTKKRLVIIAENIDDAKAVAELSSEHSVWVSKGKINEKDIFEGYRARPDVMFVSRNENYQQNLQSNVDSVSQKARKITFIHEPSGLKRLVAQQGKMALVSRLKKAKILSLSKSQDLGLSIH